MNFRFELLMQNKEQLLPRPYRVLWATMGCLLDTTSGAAMSIRQMLRQLKSEGFEIEIVGATIFDSPRGNLKLSEHWETIKNEPNKIVTIEDGVLKHTIVVTSSTNRKEMSLDEVNDWYSVYNHKLKTFKPDLVMFYGGRVVDLGIPGEARILGIPSAAYLVNENYTGTRWVRDVDLVLTDSQATSDYYKAKEGFTPVPVGKFIEKQRVVATNHERKHILFVNPSLTKGAGIVVQLALMLEKRRPDIMFEVVESRGSWQDILLAITGAHGEPRDSLANVVVTQNTDDMKTIYSRARLILAPSLWFESGARVLAEAMLNGIPAIITEHGGNREMVQNAGIGITLPKIFHQKDYTKVPSKKDLEPIAEKIAQFYDDESMYQQYVGRAYRVGQQHHDIQVSTKRLTDAIEPFTSLRAGDGDQSTLIKSIHKFGLQEHIEEHPGNEDKFDDLHVSLETQQKGLFIDCGGYDGCSAIKFMLQNPQFDSVTFEPNPALWPFYTDVPTTLVKKAAYTHSGTVKFTLDETDADGSSLIESKKVDYWGKVANEDCPQIEVQSEDIAELIRQASKSYQHIVLKLDIEGAEYDVLEKLLREDLVKHIKIIYAEFHWQKCGFLESRHQQLISALEQQTKVQEWDALDFAVYRRSTEHKEARARQVVEKLGDAARYQSTIIRQEK